MPVKQVLQICHGYDPPFLDVGNQYAQVLMADDYEVSTLYLSGSRSKQVELATIADRVHFFELDAESMKGLKFAALRKLRAMLKSGCYDMVFCHRYKSIYLAGLASLGIRGFVWVGVVHDFKVLANLSRKLFIRFFAGGLNVLGVSDAIREDILKCCPVLRGRVYSQPNCVTMNLLQASQLGREDARRELGIDQQAFIFGTAGRLHPVKDQQTLLRAFAKTRSDGNKTMVVIMGSGRLENVLKKLALELGIANRVKFLGQVEQGPRYFKAFDVFVLPSAKEPFGMVLIEAMAAGIPVVSSRTGGTAEVVGETGLMYEPGDVDGLATRLDEVYHWDSVRRNSYVEKAYQRVELCFSLRAFGERLRTLPFYPDNVPC